ncbi:MAG: GtrA family protein [Flavobacteriaceae bacterium]|jgi:putative flippase GtrA|nr:GtrA family protein [Flavobacteriaceae bacterium]
MYDRKLLKELKNYILVGIGSILIDFLSYKFFFMNLDFNLSNAKRVSFILGAIWSFVLNKKVTFKSSNKSLKEPILFSLIYLSSFIFNSLIHDLSLNYFMGNIPFLIATVFSVILNYLGQKYIVFKKR